MQRYTKGLLVTLVGLTLALLGSSLVLAHANYVRSDPPENARFPVGQPPSRVQVWFSETLEPKFSELQVLNERRERIDQADSRVLADAPQSMQVTLRPGLPDGAYTVVYKTTSLDDGHVVKNSFAFLVGAGILPAPSTSSASETANAADDNFNLWSVVVRWLNYLAGAALIGGLAWHLFIWQPALKQTSARLGPEQTEAGRMAIRRSQQLLWLALGGLGLGWLAWLVYQASRVGEVYPWQLLGNSALGDLLFNSRFGLIWLTRLGLILLTGLALLLVNTKLNWPRLYRARFNLVPESEPPSNARIVTLDNQATATTGKTGYWLVLAAGALVLLTTSLNAHAAATEPAWLFITLDWLHLLATGLWVGGLFYMALALPPALTNLRPGTGDRTRLLARLVANFSTLAIPSVAILAITGTLSAAVHLGSVEDWLSSGYGWSLLVKLVLAGLLVLLGAYHLLRVSPALSTYARRKSDHNGASSLAAGQAQIRFRRSMQIEAGLAVLLLVTVGGLTSFSPPAGNAASGLVLRGQAADLNYVLQIDPGKLGNNNFDLSLTERQNGGQPLKQADAVLLRLTMTDMEMGTQEVELKPTPNLPGHYQLQQSVLSMTGQWRAELIVRRAAKDDARAPIEFKLGS